MESSQATEETLGKQPHESRSTTGQPWGEAVMAGGLGGMASTSVSEGPGRSAVNLKALDLDGTVSALPLRLGFLIIEKSQMMPQGY